MHGDLLQLVVQSDASSSLALSSSPTTTTRPTVAADLKMSNAVPLDQFICKNVVAEGLSVRSCIINSPLLVEDRSLQNLLAHLLHAKPTALVRLDESNHWLVLLGRGDQFTDTIAGVKISVRAVDEDAVARVDVALKVAYLLKVIDVCKQRKQTTVAYNCQAAGVQDPVTVPSQTQIFGIISRSRCLIMRT
jgi:hypothetical protein